MRIVAKVGMDKILTDNKMRDILNDKNAVSIYHKNNWDHLVVHWGEKNENQTPSYIDFFFDAAYMVGFFRRFLDDLDFKYAYLSSIFPKAYKLRTNDDDVSRDVYDEYRRLFKKLGLKINTSKSIMMTKEEIINWCDRFSVAGFMGLSEFYLIIPEQKIIIEAHHHMNYVIYAKDKEKVLSQIAVHGYDGNIKLREE